MRKRGKARSGPKDEWIRNTADIGSQAYDANSDRSDF